MLAYIGALCVLPLIHRKIIKTELEAVIGALQCRAPVQDIDIGDPGLVGRAEFEDLRNLVHSLHNIVRALNDELADLYKEDVKQVDVKAEFEFKPAKKPAKKTTKKPAVNGAKKPAVKRGKNVAKEVCN